VREPEGGPWSRSQRQIGRRRRQTNLELTVPDLRVVFVTDHNVFLDCSEGLLRSWIGPPLGYAFYGYTEPGEHEEFWILDVAGGRLVIEASWWPDSPADDIAKLRQVLDSIHIES
jgi:hypothetical protein